ncbi:MAG TPA: class I SAM-dependent methyltransferase [Vineibacter sp.]|nr:class I SAM-dependent methyltransferase [Vineibacter sp.]
MNDANQVFEDELAAAIYDHFNPWSAGDDFYLELARAGGGAVLDLGCGTGLLACRIADEGLSVVGVDPAEGMLRIARARSGADKVTWVKSEGQRLDLPQRFALAYMTGHALQALLTDEDVVTVLGNVERHLAPGGKFAFETRNPLARAWLSWTPEKTRSVVDTPEHGRIEQSFEAMADADTGIVSIAQHDRYLDTGVHRVGRSRIRFVSQAQVAELLSRSGLAPLAWYGGWDRRPFTPASREIIVVAQGVQTARAV